MGQVRFPFFMVDIYLREELGVWVIFGYVNWQIFLFLLVLIFSFNYVQADVYCSHFSSHEKEKFP